MVKSSPQVLLESVSRLKDAFDYLSYMPLGAAEGLLAAIQPLLKINLGLRDSLVLVLQKAMFSR
jgi:Fanconi anemia group I protein